MTSPWPHRAAQDHPTASPESAVPLSSVHNGRIGGGILPCGRHRGEEVLHWKTAMGRCFAGKNMGKSWDFAGESACVVLIFWDVVAECWRSQQTDHKKKKIWGFQRDLFDVGDMFGNTSWNLTQLALRLQEYAFIRKWYIIYYIPQNGKFIRVHDDKEGDFGGHNHPKLLKLWSWGSIEII